MNRIMNCCLLFAVAATPLAVESISRAGPSLTSLEMKTAKGLHGGFTMPQEICGHCTELNLALCSGPHAAVGINNTCDWKGCVHVATATAPFTCGSGRKYTGQSIVRTLVEPEEDGNQRTNANTGSSWLCDYGIVCDAGAFDGTKNCSAPGPAAGSCFNGGAINKGCRPCSAGGQTDPFSHHSLEDHECEDCPGGGGTGGGGTGGGGTGGGGQTPPTSPPGRG